MVQLMIRIASCDDNEMMLSLLNEYLVDYREKSNEEIELVSFHSAADLLANVKEEGGYDIYILDIVMPGINGMEAAVTLRASLDEGIIIFLSASMEYAVSSYDVGAFYYLLKPVNPHKLEEILDKAFQVLRQDRATNLIEVKTPAGISQIDLSEICYVNIEDRSVCYHLRDGKAVLSRKLRGSFAEEVSALLENKRFVQCGAAMVLNLRMIEAIDEESILMRGGVMLYPSKSACTAVRKLWMAGKK